jgi:hypothetical protein
LDRATLNASEAHAVLVRSHAFGMDLEADFAMPGLGSSGPAGNGRSLSMRVGSVDDIEHKFPEDADRISEVRFPDGRVAYSVDAAGDLGYVAYGCGFAHAHVSVTGREVIVAPLDEREWKWQRYLIGQVLPLAAVLQGLEVFHASVLGVDGKAVAVVAHSGVGKTTTALQLALRGLDFMSDDVLVLEPDASGVRAHPAIGLANVRRGSDELLLELEQANLATPLGEDEHEARVLIPRADDARPLAALFVLERYEKPRELHVEHLKPVDPRILLAASFNFSIRTPERLVRQLDVCSRLDRCASVFRVSCGSDVTPAQVADAIFARTTDPQLC